jgi:hypothetical protein
VAARLDDAAVPAALRESAERSRAARTPTKQHSGGQKRHASLRSPPRGWRRLAAGAAIALLPLLSPGQLFAAGPQAATADQALPLTQPLSGHLGAGLGGQFAYYSFVYPGDQSTVTIDLEVRPDDPALLPRPASTSTARARASSTPPAAPRPGSIRICPGT